MTVDNLLYGYIVDEVDYQDKNVIIEEGSRGDWAYVVLEGRVKAKKKTAKGMLTLATLQKGAVFGEIPLLLKQDKVRTATIQADGPVKVGILDSARLDRELKLLSPQLRGLMRTLARRFSETVDKISRIAAT